MQAYKDFVTATDTNKAEAEQKFAEISANVNKIVTDYGDSVIRWQYVNGYMDVGDQGLKLGRDGDSTSILIQNNRISMISAGEEVMSISDGVIKIDNGVFTKTLRIGIAYNKTTATESTSYSDYTWSLIKGDNGVQGPAGINGQTLYTWVKYADDDKGAGMSDSLS